MVSIFYGYHANFTCCPFSFTIHLESICSSKATTSLLWEMTHWKIITIDRRFIKEKRKSLPILCLYYWRENQKCNSFELGLPIATLFNTPPPPPPPPAPRRSIINSYHMLCPYFDPPFFSVFNGESGREFNGFVG